jgi:sugar transferase (PEP-CTERM/EpsH1 system associated)
MVLRAIARDVEPDLSVPGDGAHSRVVTTRPVRVMHVVYRLQAGGMEYGVLKIVNALDRRRVQSSVCSTTPATDVKTLLRPDVPLFEFHRRHGNDARLVLDLLRLFRRERPDIVHTHSWGTLLEGLAAARIAGVPKFVHGEHGTLQLRSYQRTLQRFAWSRADLVLSVSSRLAERMTDATGFPMSRITTIRNGVNVERFATTRRRDARATLNLPDSVVAVGTVGRLVPVKDQATLIRAIARLRSQSVDATLFIAGDGPLRGELEALASAERIAPHVQFLGHRPDVEAVLAALDIFVLCSLSEGLSNTILEAMASGVPVVSTSVGGADELVQPGVTGLLVPAAQPEALASALAILCASPVRRREMGDAGRTRARIEFSVGRMVRSYEDAYVRLGAGLETTA